MVTTKTVSNEHKRKWEGNQNMSLQKKKKKDQWKLKEDTKREKEGQKVIRQKDNS